MKNKSKLMKRFTLSLIGCLFLQPGLSTSAVMTRQGSIEAAKSAKEKEFRNDISPDLIAAVEEELSAEEAESSSSDIAADSNTNAPAESSNIATDSNTNAPAESSVGTAKTQILPDYQQAGYLGYKNVHLQSPQFSMGKYPLESVKTNDCAPGGNNSAATTKPKTRIFTRSKQKPNGNTPAIDPESTKYSIKVTKTGDSTVSAPAADSGNKQIEIPEFSFSPKPVSVSTASAPAADSGNKKIEIPEFSFSPKPVSVSTVSAPAAKSTGTAKTQILPDYQQAGCLGYNHIQVSQWPALNYLFALQKINDRAPGGNSSAAEPKAKIRKLEAPQANPRPTIVIARPVNPNVNASKTANTNAPSSSESFEKIARENASVLVKESKESVNRINMKNEMIKAAISSMPAKDAKDYALSYVEKIRVSNRYRAIADSVDRAIIYGVPAKDAQDYAISYVDSIKYCSNEFGSFLPHEKYALSHSAALFYINNYFSNRILVNSNCFPDINLKNIPFSSDNLFDIQRNIEKSLKLNVPHPSSDKRLAYDWAQLEVHIYLVNQRRCSCTETYAQRVAGDHTVKEPCSAAEEAAQFAQATRLTKATINKYKEKCEELKNNYPNMSVEEANLRTIRSAYEYLSRLPKFERTPHHELILF